MEDWWYNSLCWFIIIFIAKVNIEKDQYGTKLKYPKRQCKDCLKYPCFPEIEKCSSNFAAYGCFYYKGPCLSESK